MHKIWIWMLLGICSLSFGLPEHYGSSSLANYLHLKKAKDPIDGGWLPDLTGLPSMEELDEMLDDLVALVDDEQDPHCRAIHPKLRMLFFEHFMVYQKMANAQHIYLNHDNTFQWAHLMAMTLQESDGDTTNVTDFQGHSFSPSSDIMANLQRWRRILTLSAQTRIQLNLQTNFGLTQLSADRVFIAFKLAREQRYDTEYLEGLEGADTPHKIPLNTAIAVRRLIWLYQDFAQGRIHQEEDRIHARDSQKPENRQRLKEGIAAAIRYCGTNHLFIEGQSDIEKLKEAMASIAYCKLGNAQDAYHDVDAICFAKVVTLCPALNIDIATITPLSYFASRDANPVCEKTFRQLLIKKPFIGRHILKMISDKWDALLKKIHHVI